MPLGPGARLDAYELIRPLGTGGMGEVWLARDVGLGRNVALKLLPQDFTNDERRVARFEQEARAASALSHPNICHVYALGQTAAGQRYIAMELVEGATLRERLQGSHLSLADALKIASQIGAAVSAAHAAGIVHRDLKPENVIVRPDGLVKVLDFGLAKLSQLGDGSASSDEVTHTVLRTDAGTVVGTIAYMSPEQARGQATDSRTDIWSLGVLVYEMVAGHRPFTGQSSSDVVAAILEHEADPLTRFDPPAPPELLRIVSKALRKDREQRYQTMKDLMLDVQALHEEVTTRARSDSEVRLSGGHASTPSAESVVTLVGRHKIRASLVALLSAVAVIAVGGWYTWHTGGRIGPVVQQEPVSVLIANFENKANDPLFDGLVEQALGVGIEGASFVAAYSRRDALRVAQQINPSASLDEANARLVATREGIMRVLGGSITASGSKYAVSAKILDPADGRSLQVWDTEASSKDDVLNAVARLAAKVRGGLGDKTASADAVKAAETFTAASLQAAHEYTQAQEFQGAGRYAEALQCYKKALTLDPQFGRAYAGLGAVSSSMGRRDEAIDYYRQALDHIDRMTDREKFRTRGGYYLLIRDLDKAREQFETLVKQFPADSTGLSNLAVVAAGQRDMSGALEIGRRASQIYPNNVLRRNNVALFALYGGDFRNAERLATEVLGLNKTFEKAYVVTAMAQLGTGRLQEADDTWRHLQTLSDVGRDFAAHGRTDLKMYEGRLADASSILEDTLLKPRERRTTARLMTTLAEVRVLQGRNADAVKLAEDALRTSGDESIVLLAGRVLISAGRVDRGEALAADLVKKFDRQAQMFGKLLAGEAELKRGDAHAAVENFNAAQLIIDTWLGREGLGRAYLDAGVYTDAQTEFDRCLARKGEATTFLLDDIPTYHVMPAVRYYMGRAQEGHGSPAAKAAAFESYKAFLAVKEKGDEQGLVADARRRVAAMHRQQ